MKRIVQGGLLVALIAILAACRPVEPVEPDIGPAVEELRDRYVEAYNRHDAATVAAQYTDNALYVNAQGTEITGRDQIQRELESFFLEARPQLNAFPIATEGGGRLGWEIGKYLLVLELQLPAQPPPAEPLPGEPGAPGAEPIDEPAATARPGQPGATTPPGQPTAGAPHDQDEEGHCLIVLEQADDDRWLIRAHMTHAGSLASAMSPRQPVTIPTTPGQERPLQPPPPATGPAAGEPARTQPRETSPPPSTPEPEEGTDLGEDDLEPPPGDGDGSPGR
jgi:hypothetical protein